MPVLLDFESRSRADLSAVGGRNYWAHPSTEALCCVLYDTDGGAVEVWQRGDPPPLLVRPDTVLGAHNMTGFDRFGLARLGWRGLDKGPPHIDTSELARSAGLPGKLDALAFRWLGMRKDKASSRFTVGLSTCRRPSGKRNPNAISALDWGTYTPAQKRALGVQPEITADVMARVVPYCAGDVEVLAHGWPLLASWLDVEPDVVRVDRAVNDRGIRFDSALARRLLECDAQNADVVMSDVARELGAGWTAARVREVVGSPAKFCAESGAPNAQKETIEEMLLGGLPWLRLGVSQRLARARQALASIARGKLEAGLARVSPDGRLRDNHRIYGAHTWRWSGLGMQLQNMPRPEKRFELWGDAEICALADHVMAGRNADAGEIDLLLRACFVADDGYEFIVCDFSGVEARDLWWRSGDQPALDALARGISNYKLMAATIYGCSPEMEKGDPRYSIGKQTELACQYGMGHVKFGRTARKNGCDLEATGIDAKVVVDAWRGQHPAIVRFWGLLEQAFALAAQGETTEANGFTFAPSDDGKDVAIWMPSGHPIVYPNVHLAAGKWGRPQISYEGTKDARALDENGERVGDPLPKREHVYGGLLAENVISSDCRDLMARALVRAEDDGLLPCLDVHDEIVGQVPAGCVREGYEHLRTIMLDLPEYAEGFPVGAAGHTGKRYRK